MIVVEDKKGILYPIQQAILSKNDEPPNFGTQLATSSSKERSIMIVTKKVITEKEGEKDWENPTNPEAPTDAREKEQAQRMYEEAQRRNENLTDIDENNKKN